MRIVILGGDVDNNLGDQAILQATCQELKCRWPEVEIAVVSRHGERAGRQLGVRALRPGLAGLPALLLAAARADLVLCGGGGLFQDDDSLIKMPYWALRLLLMRLVQPRIAGYALGVGPLRAHSSRLAARLAFACMSTVSVRDGEAAAAARPLTARPVALLADPALLLRPARPERAAAYLADHGVPQDGRPLIGVAPRRWFPPAPRLIPHRLARRLGLPDPQAGPQGERLLDLLARLLDRMVERHGAHIVFLPTYTLAHEADDRLAAGILARMRRKAGQVLRIDDPPLYQAVTGKLQAMLGGRMHPTILAASMGTPVVGLAYNPKFQGLFDLLGMPEQVHDVAGFVREGRVDALAASLEAALAGRRADPERIEALAAGVRGFLAARLTEARTAGRAFAT
ncbi:polysaccharide pyruvyl transferase family protein [Falsiroseomonas sp. E2-1-a20]|uniref:polysaccharide pyruvyl transferase family protein n=1 Tax=Falsiroseomonas sp. E2-1-a20 TaxID=3239300 RepID=UPI003F2B5445